MIRRQREDRSGWSAGVWGDEGKATREIKRENKHDGESEREREREAEIKRLDGEKERREAETTDSRGQEESER